jgi:Cu2+-exporting ATPase
MPTLDSTANPILESVTKETITLDVGGMKCAGCVLAVERQLKQNTGVIAVCVNLATEIATIECETGKVNADAIAQKLTENGFPTQPRYPDSQENPTLSAMERQRQAIHQQIRQLIIALVLIILSGIGHFVGNKIPLLNNIGFHWGLATIALLIPGREILIDGARGLSRNSPNMNTLVGLGALSAYSASVIAVIFPQLGWECFFDEPVMLLGFILLGKTLEQQAKNRASSALYALIALQPTTARLIHGNNDNFPLSSQSSPMPNSPAIEIPCDRVRVGEWLQVLPGEKIPVDGEIWEGKTTVNEAMLTGESHPVIKQKGDSVSAGTINQSGMLILRATRIGKETTLAQIVKMVEDAQTRKAPIQFLADSVAGFFAYGVMSISALTFLFWYFLLSHIWPEILISHSSMDMGMDMGMSLRNTTELSPILLSLKLAISVLVIACPCALGLATPTAILVGSGIGAEKGLLIRGGDVLEQVNQLNTVIFDKTGTLTTGTPTITDYFLVTENGEWLVNDPPQILFNGLKNDPPQPPLLRGEHDTQITLNGLKNDPPQPPLIRGEHDTQITLNGLKNDPPQPPLIRVGHDTQIPLRRGGNVTDNLWVDPRDLPSHLGLLKIAATVESGASHPIANAICEDARKYNLPLLEAQDFYTEPGLGASAIINGKTILVGNSQWLAQNGVNLKNDPPFNGEAKTLVYVAVGGVLMGGIALKDTLRSDAKVCIQRLKEMGLRVMLLTGDREEVAQTIASELEIEANDILAEIKPDGKAETIRELQQKRDRVAMVGDGINDAPALAQADVGIALHGGTDVAVETAKIVLMRDNLMDVVHAIELGRATFHKIQQNLFWAFLYNTLGIPIAAGLLLPSFGIVLSPAVAGAFMAFSSVSVVTNSLLLRHSFQNGD